MIQIKVIGNINNLNRDRKFVLNRYKKIKSRWERKDSCLKNIFINEYNKICDIVNRLESGEEFEFISGTKEQYDLIVQTGRLIGSQEILHSADKHIEK